jgi:hypothetical protein
VTEQGYERYHLKVKSHLPPVPVRDGVECDDGIFEPGQGMIIKGITVTNIAPEDGGLLCPPAGVVALNAWADSTALPLGKV